MFRNRKGFTLLELIVVMAVVAILIAVGVPFLKGRTAEADYVRKIHDVALVEDALLRYGMDNGSYPTGEMGSDALFWDLDALASEILTEKGLANRDGNYIDIEQFEYPRRYLGPEHRAYQVNLAALGDYVHLRKLQDFYVALPVKGTSGDDPVPDEPDPPEPDPPEPDDPDPPEPPDDPDDEPEVWVPVDPPELEKKSGEVIKTYHHGKSDPYTINQRLGYMSNSLDGYYWGGKFYSWASPPRQFVPSSVQFPPTAPVDILSEYGTGGWRYSGEPLEWAEDILDASVYASSVYPGTPQFKKLRWARSEGYGGEEGWHWVSESGKCHRYRKAVKIWYVRGKNMSVKTVSSGNGNSNNSAVEMELIQHVRFDVNPPKELRLLIKNTDTDYGVHRLINIDFDAYSCPGITTSRLTSLDYWVVVGCGSGYLYCRNPSGSGSIKIKELDWYCPGYTKYYYHGFSYPVNFKFYTSNQGTFFAFEGNVYKIYNAVQMINTEHVCNKMSGVLSVYKVINPEGINPYDVGTWGLP